MKRGIAGAIIYIKSLLGLVRQEPVVQLRVKKTPEPKVHEQPSLGTYDEDISPGIGHFNFNKLRTLKENGIQINKDFYDENGDLIDYFGGAYRDF